MILVQHEPSLTAKDAWLKAQVVTCLKANHAYHEFHHPEDLEVFLEGVLDDIERLWLPRRLTRVFLFCFDTGAMRVVGQRMIEGGSFHTFRLPHAWKLLGDKLPELRAWTRRMEPDWAELSKGL